MTTCGPPSNGRPTSRGRLPRACGWPPRCGGSGRSGHAVEGRAWLERMLEASGEGESLASRSSALTGAGVLAYLQGDYDGAFAFHEESLILHRQVGNPQSVAYAANNLANAAVQQGDYARARSLYEEALGLQRGSGDIRGSAMSLINLADVVARQGDLEMARSLFEESIATFREHGDDWGKAFALDSFGVVALRHGDQPSARALQEEAMEISCGLGDERGVARALAHLAEVAAAEGDSAEARRLHRESLGIRQRLGDMPGITGLEKLAAVVSAEAPATAGQLLGRAEALRQFDPRADSPRRRARTTIAVCPAHRGPRCGAAGGGPQRGPDDGNRGAAGKPPSVTCTISSASRPCASL